MCKKDDKCVEKMTKSVEKMTTCEEKMRKCVTHFCCCCRNSLKGAKIMFAGNLELLHPELCNEQTNF